MGGGAANGCALWASQMGGRRGRAWSDPWRVGRSRSGAAFFQLLKGNPPAASDKRVALGEPFGVVKFLTSGQSCRSMELMEIVDTGGEVISIRPLRRWAISN